MFVADSQSSMRESNVESLENLRTNLRLNRIDPDKVALVFQYNKRDLPNVDTIDDMSGYLHPGAAPVVEAAAINGAGVTATLRTAVARILENLKTNVDTTLYDEPHLVAPDMRAKAGVIASSRMRTDVGRASPRPPEPIEEEPFGAVAVEVESENPFAIAAEIHDPGAERGELEALLSGATAVVHSLEAALDRAREQERALRDRLARG